jgi:hypothetical protein
MTTKKDRAKCHFTEKWSKPRLGVVKLKKILNKRPKETRKLCHISPHTPLQRTRSRPWISERIACLKHSRRTCKLLPACLSSLTVLNTPKSIFRPQGNCFFSHFVIASKSISNGSTVLSGTEKIFRWCQIKSSFILSRLLGASPPTPTVPPSVSRLLKLANPALVSGTGYLQ